MEGKDPVSRQDAIWERNPCGLEIVGMRVFRPLGMMLTEMRLMKGQRKVKRPGLDDVVWEAARRALAKACRVARECRKLG